MGRIKSYKELIVWQKSMDLVEKVYLLLVSFPDDEKFGLTSQIKRSSVSIPSNIAEGFGHSSKNFSRFLKIARGSLQELETQLEIAKRLNFVDTIEDTEDLIKEILKMLNSLIYKNLNY